MADEKLIETNVPEGSHLRTVRVEQSVYAPQRAAFVKTCRTRWDGEGAHLTAEQVDELIAALRPYGTAQPMPDWERTLLEERSRLVDRLTAETERLDRRVIEAEASVRTLRAEVEEQTARAEKAEIVAAKAIASTESSKPAGPRPLAAGDRVVVKTRTRARDASGAILDAGVEAIVAAALGRFGTVLVRPTDGRPSRFVAASDLVRASVGIIAGDEVIVTRPHALGGTVGKTVTLPNGALRTGGGGLVRVEVAPGSVVAFPRGYLRRVDPLPVADIDEEV